MNQIAKTISTLSLCLLLYALPAVAQNDVGTNPKEQTAKVNVTVDRQVVRFTAQEDGAARRLMVTNQQGEAIFDSGFTSGNILEWSPKGLRGGAVASGIYRYTLTTIADPDALPITEQGQVIVDRAGSKDRMWLTSGTQTGVGADGRMLKVTIMDDYESRIRTTEGVSQSRQTNDRTATTNQAGTAGSDDKKPTATVEAHATVEANTFPANGATGVGTATPTDLLDVTGDGTTGGQIAFHGNFANGAELYAHAAAAFRGPTLGFYKSRGTQASPTAAQSADNLAYLNFGGHNGTSYVTAAGIWSQAGSNWSGTDNSADLQFYVTNTSATTPTRALYVAPSGKVSIGGGALLGQNDLTLTGALSVGQGAYNTAAPAYGAIIQGSVGIGTSSVSNLFKLQVAGSVGPYTDNGGNLGNSSLRWQLVYSTNGLVQTSDARFKKGMTNLNYGLREVMQLRPISFQWKDSSNTKPQIGLVAQEVEKVIPEVVQRDANASAPLGMNYGNLVPVVIKAVQEQQATITTLKNENAELKQQNAALEARLSALEKKLEQTAPAPRQ